MAHMVLEHWAGEFSLMVDPYGDHFWIPSQYADDSDAKEVERGHKFGVRWSAPGYLDCTEWDCFDTQDEADARAQEMLDEDKDGWE